MAVRKKADGAALHALFREVFHLRTALAEHMDALHERAGLTTPQAQMMHVLSRHGSATVPELAQAHLVSRQFVQTVCNGLAERGLIVFTDNPRHKRSKLARLTAAGEKTFARFSKAEAEEIGKLMPRFDAAKVAAAEALLRDIRDFIEGGTP